MATIADLVARSADLKRELVEYGKQPRYHRAFRKVLSERDVEIALLEEEELVTLMDHFLLQHQLPNGKTVVEQFVAVRPDLSEDERELLLGWRDVVEGVFEVQRRDGDAIEVENLIDDLSYRVHSNKGPTVFRHMARGSFLMARLVPVGSEWLISGSIAILPARGRKHVYRAAADFAVHHPDLIFRNPEKLALAWELQRAERERFVRFFGTDMVVLRGDQFTDQMRQYHEFSRKELLATLPARRRWGRRADTPAPELIPESDLVAADTVAVIYDEVEGLNFYTEFGLVEAVFADPALVRSRVHKQQLLDYLDDDTVSPLPFRRLADRDPAQASLLFQKLLRRPRFDWRRDGEELLRKRKAWFFEKPPRPSVSPLSKRLAQYVGQS